MRIWALLVYKWRLSAFGYLLSCYYKFDIWRDMLVFLYMETSAMKRRIQFRLGNPPCVSLCVRLSFSMSITQVLHFGVFQRLLCFHLG
jgi:hypothetical protein